MLALETSGLWAMLVYSAAAVLTAAGMIGLSYVLGQRHAERQTGEPYESGVVSTGGARLRLPVKYYLVAMLFVVFDLEAAFLFAWALVTREAGWPGYAEALVFIAILLAALAYLWRAGALEWGTRRKARHLAPRELAGHLAPRDLAGHLAPRDLAGHLAPREYTGG